VSLPMHPYLSQEDQQKVVIAVGTAIGQAQRSSRPST
jgi:dTDP-4-amino-4,6-dideoxygalactose transaminase